MALTTVTITAQYSSGKSTVYAAGQVFFNSVGRVPIPSQNVIVEPLTVSVTLDGTGSLSVTLIAADDPVSHAPIRYQVVETLDSVPEVRYEIEVPESAASGGLNLADVPRFDITPVAVNILTTANFNQPNGVPQLDGTGVLAGYATVANLGTTNTNVSTGAANLATLDSREAGHYASLNARLVAGGL